MSQQSRTASGRAAIAIGDQALSSAGNFVVILAAAHFLLPHALGTFTIAYACYSVMIGLGVAIVGDPTVLTVGPSVGAPAERRQILATAALLGIATALAAVLIGTAWAAQRAGFLALAAFLPGLAAQDASRYLFVATGRPQRALVMDLAWTGTSATAIGALAALGEASNWQWLLVAWAAPGSLTGYALLLRWRASPRLSGAQAWLASRRLYWTRFLVEFASTVGSWQATFAATIAFVSAASAGDLRAATALFGVIHVLFNGFRIGVTPELVRRTSRAQPILAICVGIGLVLGVFAGAFGLGLAALPKHATHLLLGANSVGIIALLGPLTLQKAADGVVVGAFSGLRAYHLTDTTMKSRLAVGVGSFALGSAGAALFGVKGAAYGIAIASTCGIVVWWPTFIRHARSSASNVESRVVRVATTNHIGT